MVEQKQETSILSAIKTRERIRILLLLESLIIGLLVGILISFYRLLIPRIGHYFQLAYAWGRANTWQAFLVVLGLSLIGAFVGYLSQLEPKIGGSGIPQVVAQLRGQMKMKWQKVLPLKFIGGILALGAGLKVGREGPSIQMGAAIGQGFGELLKRPLTERRYLITGGAAAGLAAAFNAPLSGVIFVLEEVHHNFSSLALIAAMGASFSADFFSVQILGHQPVIELGTLKTLSASSYLLVILLGIFIAFTSFIFTGGISFFKKIYARINLPQWVKVIFPFCISAIIILINSSAFGSNEELIFLPLHGNVSLPQLIFLYFLNLFLLLIAFSSGMPGGIFFPMLVLGSLIGNIFGEIFVSFGILLPDEVIIFAVLAMCGSFAAIVRSPLTGIMLTIELTGSFTFLLPLGVIAFASYLMAEAIHLEPVYEMLLDYQLYPQKLKNKFFKTETEKLQPKDLELGSGKVIAETSYANHGVLVQYPIYINSAADQKTIAEIIWPKNLLLVSIRRGDQEILPKGYVRLQAGDYLVAMHPFGDSAEIAAEMDQITKKQI